MKTVVIGGRGHIGTYLVPRLVENGHEVVSISRGHRELYTRSGMWNWVEQLQIDRTGEEEAGRFGTRISALEPDIVVDLIAFKPESVVQITEALHDSTGHYLFCSSIWAHGAATVSPASDDLPRRFFGEYGINKAKCEEVTSLIDRGMITV